MGGFCGCQFSTRPDGPGLICNEPAKHRGPHQAHGVTWPQLFEPTRGGDYDPRDQVGVEDTGPAVAAGPTAGPPERLIGYRTADGHLWRPDDVEIVYEAVTADGR